MQESISSGIIATKQSMDCMDKMEPIQDMNIEKL